jgi:hypothetical protein
VRRGRPDVPRGVCSIALALSLIWGAGSALARTGPQLKTVRYHGYAARVPASWPVYDLAREPQTCVRFNRHAVYVGTPGEQQLCPAHAAGHTSALLLEPAGRGVKAITSAAGTRPDSSPRARAAASPRAHAASVYTGNGFDVCDTPSTRTMSDWSSAPYRAIGVYIGGVNAACSQGNLTSSWVGTEVAAGWHVIPIYVGLQAPSNSCGCSGITASQASAQGTAAADDAISDAQSLGIPRGNPVYDDMESYPTGGSNSRTVLTFLSAWTSELHAKGYVSGVYSSASTGVSDLVAQYGSGYEEPDDLWIADWNNSKSTSDPYVPSSDWSNHQRLHQYSGSHNETYGGATLNIDGDWVDGATAGTAAGTAPTAPEPPAPAPPPTLSISSASDGTMSISSAWSGQGLIGWRVLAGTSPTALSSVGGGSAHGGKSVFKVADDAPFFAVQALGPNGAVLATSTPVAAPAHIAVFGHSAFVSARGTGGIPVGCYAAQTCHIATTITEGGTKIASTGTEAIPSGATALLFFTVSSTGRFMLANAAAARLPVRISLHETGGSTATIPLTLIPFTTSGRGPRKSVDPAAPVRILGATDFVPGRGMGGILAACDSTVPCHIAAKLTSGRTTLATTGTETVGGEQAGYVFFSLSRAGRRLLERTAGNQLGASVTLTDAGAVARGSIALVGF